MVRKVILMLVIRLWAQDSQELGTSDKWGLTDSSPYLPSLALGKLHPLFQKFIPRNQMLWEQRQAKASWGGGSGDGSVVKCLLNWREGLSVHSPAHP